MIEPIGGNVVPESSVTPKPVINCNYGAAVFLQDICGIQRWTLIDCWVNSTIKKLDGTEASTEPMCGIETCPKRIKVSIE